jgi:hypothetical protein
MAGSLRKIPDLCNLAIATIHRLKGKKHYVPKHMRSIRKIAYLPEERLKLVETLRYLVGTTKPKS